MIVHFIPSKSLGLLHLQTALDEVSGFLADYGVFWKSHWHFLNILCEFDLTFSFPWHFAIKHLEEEQSDGPDVTF